MPVIDFSVETTLTHTARVKQLSGMFDVPAQEKLAHHWQGEVPLDERDWNVGLIVGPSGAGKTTVARQLFGEMRALEWKASSVVDDFDSAHSIEDIAAVCNSVGFSTIPSWMKSYAVLSTGERFRVEVARHMLEGGDLIVIDEFTSVIDRQVAQIGAHAVQKLVRKRGKKFVAVTCHYDVVEWLQPDWVLEPATMTFTWRSLQRRPTLDVEISRVDYSSWKLFAPFHYLTREMHKQARCFVLFVRGVPASFIAIINIPHQTRRNLRGVSRAVTLPDYQGIGLTMVLAQKVCAAYRAFGIDVHHFPAHPPFIRALDRSPDWKLIKKPGFFSKPNRQYSRRHGMGIQGGRPCAVFEYVGAALDRETATQLLGPTVYQKVA